MTKKERNNSIVLQPNKDNKQQNQLEEPSYTITEGNFLLYQFASLGSHTVEKDRLISEVITEETNDSGAKKVQKWKVTGDVELGFPGWLDEKVFIAVIEVAKQQSYPVENPIPINISEVCRIMDINDKSGKNRANVRESLQRIGRVRVIAEDSFFYKKEEARISDTFSYFQRVQLADAKVQGEEISTTKVWLSDKVLSNINDGYIRLLDTNFFMKLAPIAGRLYEILSSKMFGLLRAMQDKGKYSQEWYITESYGDLCYRMPVRQYEYRSRAVQQFNNAHEQLLDTGFLKEVEWQEDNTIRYYPGEKAVYDFKNALHEISKQIELPFLQKSAQSPREAIQAVKSEQERRHEAALTERGVSGKQAYKIVEDYGSETIQWEGEKYPVIDFYCEYYDWLIETNHRQKPKSGAWLYKAITEGWQPPREFQTAYQKKAAQERRERQKQRQKEQEKSRQEQQLKDQYSDWLQKSPEEHWQERQFLYKLEFKKEQGRQPTPTELEEAKQNYLNDPESPEQYQQRIFGEVRYPTDLSELSE